MIPEIFSHRSIRSYLPEPVPEEVLRRILEAGVRASTEQAICNYTAWW